MDFEKYWEDFGELHASMCNGDIKQFAKEIWGSAQSELDQANAKLKAQILNLESICENWFRDPMYQTYAVSNFECLFCGCTRGRDGGEDHSVADCPHMKYLEYKGEL